MTNTKECQASQKKGKDFGVLEGIYDEYVAKYRSSHDDVDLYEYYRGRAECHKSIACFTAIIFGNNSKFALDDTDIPLSELIGERMAVVKRIVRELIKDEAETLFIMGLCYYSINKTSHIFNYKYDFSDLEAQVDKYSRRVNDVLLAIEKGCPPDGLDLLEGMKLTNRIGSFYIAYKESYREMLDEYRCVSNHHDQMQKSSIKKEGELLVDDYIPDLEELRDQGSGKKDV